MLTVGLTPFTLRSARLFKARLWKCRPMVTARSLPRTRNSQSFSRSRLSGGIRFGGQDLTVTCTCITPGTVTAFSCVLFTTHTHLVLISEARKLRLVSFRTGLVTQLPSKDWITGLSDSKMQSIHYHAALSPGDHIQWPKRRERGRGMVSGWLVSHLLHCPRGSWGRHVLHCQGLQPLISRHQYLLDIN